MQNSLESQILWKTTPALSGPRTHGDGGEGGGGGWPGRVRGRLGASSSPEMASIHSRVNGCAALSACLFTIGEKWALRWPGPVTTSLGPPVRRNEDTQAVPAEWRDVPGVRR